MITAIILLILNGAYLLWWLMKVIFVCVWNVCIILSYVWERVRPYVIIGFCDFGIWIINKIEPQEQGGVKTV